MVSVDTLDYGEYDSVTANSGFETPVTYKLRWKAEVDTPSDHEDAIVYDYFDITIQYTCKFDTVALTNSGAGQSYYEYTLGTTTGNNFAKTTTHDQTCPFSMEC